MMNVSKITIKNVSRSFERSAAKTKVWDTLSALREARDLTDVSATMKNHCSQSGFDNYGFAIKRRGLAKSSGVLATVLDFPSGWAKRYEALGDPATTANDPVIQHVTTVLVPTTWDCTGRITFTEPGIARSARNLLGAAGEHSLKTGLTIPLFAPDLTWAFLVLSSRSAVHATDLLPELPWACLLGQAVMLAMRRLTWKETSISKSLSDREYEVLRWCSVGKTSWEIGQILTISEATVNFHVKNAAQKLGTSSRQATCAQAISLGLVKL